MRALAPMDDARRKEFSAVADRAERLFVSNSALALMLIDADGQVLYEKYRLGAGPDSLLIGYSMSKSATALAVGQALCDGAIGSLDDAAETYADALKGTAYGEASVRELLMMASAGHKAVFAGQPSMGFSAELLRRGTRTLRDSFAEFGRPGPNASQRGVFEYKGLDTYALGAVVAGATREPFDRYFARAVWHRVGADADAAWLVDRNGDAATASGFGARLRDWGRLALYVRDRMREGDRSCMGRFVQEATPARIANASRRTGGAFANYGYQFWSGNRTTRPEVAWMLGFGGQRVAIDPRSGRVLVLSAHAEDFMPLVYALFDDWSSR